MIVLCKACGTSYETAGSHPERCKICEDERQYVPVGGQEWVALDAVKFKRLYGAFAGQNIKDNAADVVRRSGEKYIACLR